MRVNYETMTEVVLEVRVESRKQLTPPEARTEVTTEPQIEASNFDVGTQTTQGTIASMPKLTKCTKINKEDIIMLNEEAFVYKRNGRTRSGIDIYIYSLYGSATRAK